MKNSTKGILNFDLEYLKNLIKTLIINNYKNNILYEDLNKCPLDLNKNLYLEFTYLTSRLMYYLNCYAIEKKIYYCRNEKLLFVGDKLSYFTLTQYERAKGEIIMLSTFTKAYEDEIIAKNFSGRNDSIEIYNNISKFSVIFIINHLFKSNWISNAIIMDNYDRYISEKEVILLPYSFYYIKKVKIDINKYIADIYLETIGRTEI